MDAGQPDMIAGMADASREPGAAEKPDFAARIVAWQRTHGRHDLPWQNTRDPYRIWVSEIMLQQTQVSAVIDYYQRFLARFPDLVSLARAQEDEVLALWSGLGYYARARNLHRAVRLVVADMQGEFPADYAAVCALPGIGRSTASAICAFAYGLRKAILDGNVKRVLARHFGIEGFPGERRVEQRMWALSEELLPGNGIEAYTQGLMDLGARVCVRAAPKCAACPVAATCVALRERRTGVLPAPRPAKVLPQRETTMLLLYRHGELLLEKRPAPGIWGGLWCFPEVDGARVEQECMARFATRIDAVERLGRVDHGFTHFRLRIHPVLARATQVPTLEQPGRLWLAPEEALGAAIPVPVRRILRALDASGTVRLRF
jgi:A/G-specific adenine glycosylase